MIQDIVVTGIELGILVSVFVLVNWIVGVAFKAIVSSALENPKSKSARYRGQVRVILLLLCALLCLCLIGVNGYIIYQKKSVLEFQLNLLKATPQEFWVATGVALVKCVLLVFIVKLLLQAVPDLIDKVSTAAKDVDQIQGNDESIGLFFTLLTRILVTGTWIWTAVLCAQFLQVPTSVTKVFYWGLGTYLTISLGMLILNAIPILIDTLDGLSARFANSNRILKFYERFRGLLPALKRCLEFVIYVGTASIVFRYTNPTVWLAWYGYRVIGVIGTYFFSCLLIELAGVLVDEFAAQTEGLTETQKKRRLTIAPLVNNFARYGIYFAALVVALGLFKVDPTPILAGAGILGLAVGFGAQNLINDIVCGFLILFENYYLVGDYIQAGRMEERSIEGFVEAIELRTTQVRHPDGQLQIIRNGEIGSIVNYSKQYINAKVDIPLAYEVNLDSAYSLIEAVGRQLQSDCPDIVIQPTQVEGLESLGKSLLLVRTITTVQPGQHLYIQRLLRRQLKEAFDQSSLQLSDYEPDNRSEEEESEVWQPTLEDGLNPAISSNSSQKDRRDKSTNKQSANQKPTNRRQSSNTQTREGQIRNISNRVSNEIPDLSKAPFGTPPEVPRPPVIHQTASNQAPENQGTQDVMNQDQVDIFNPDIFRPDIQPPSRKISKPTLKNLGRFFRGRNSNQ